MITGLGAAFALVAVVLLATGRGLPMVLALAATVPTGVAVSIGNGQEIPMFYAFAVVAAAALLLHRRSPVDGPLHGRAVLIAFGLYALLITLVGPVLFRGVPVLSPRNGIDAEVDAPSPLAYSISNLAQAGYLVLGLAVVLYLGRHRLATANVITIALSGSTVLSFWRLLSLHTPIPFPEGFFDNSTSVRFIDTTATGDLRFRGISSEPSGLARDSALTIVNLLASWRHLSSRTRLGAAAVVAMAATNATASTSAGVLVVAVLFAAGGLALVLAGVVRSRTIPAWLAAAWPFSLIAIPILPMLLGVMTSALASKSQTGSFSNRTSADLFSLELLVRSWFLGVGLGSNRPSSFFPMLLSCVGLLGTLLFVIAAAILIRHAWRRPALRSVAVTFVALITAKSVTGSNLSDELIWLCLGVMAAGVWGIGADARPATGVGVPSYDSRPRAIGAAAVPDPRSLRRP